MNDRLDRAGKDTSILTFPEIAGNRYTSERAVEFRLEIARPEGLDSSVSRLASSRIAGIATRRLGRLCGKIFPWV